MDEGNSIIKFIKKRKANSISSPKKNINSFMGLINKEAPEITFFSSYDIDVPKHDKLIKCTYSYSKSQLKVKNYDADKVLIVGSPYVEDKILLLSDYINLLTSITFYFSNKKMIYIPHRREISENLDIYHSKLNFIVSRLFEPIEFYIQNEPEIPLYLCGFYSAAILNINRICGSEELKIISFKFPTKKLIRTDLVSVIEEIYHTYEKNHIPVVELA